MTNPSAADLIVGNLDPKRLVAALSDLAVEWRIVEQYPDATAFHVTASDEQWSHLSDVAGEMVKGGTHPGSSVLMLLHDAGTGCHTFTDGAWRPGPSAPTH